MKELSIEEKAKRYDEALASAKNTIEVNQAIPDIVDCVESLFPELADEDERIRKALINQFSDYKRRGENHGFGYSNDKILAWLEKQGELKLVDDANDEAEKEKNDYVSGQFLYCKGSFNEFKEGESYWIEYIGNDTYIGRSDNILNQKFHITPRQLYTWLDPRHPEKQDEQKPIKEHDICNTCEEKASCIIPCPMKLVGQKPTDWSEDDENNINSIVSRLEVDISYWESRSKTRTNEDKKLIEWLKFLKDRYTWKPSDEQITWLYRAVDDASKDSRMKQVLNELLSDLKKLRGE